MRSLHSMEIAGADKPPGAEDTHLYRSDRTHQVERQGDVEQQEHPRIHFARDPPGP
jgi:hypothetical protein